MVDTGAPLILHTRVVTEEGGGPEKTILNSPRFLPELGYRAICAYMRDPKDRGFEKVRERAVQCSAPLIEIDDRGPLDLGIFQRHLEICRENNVAIWHAHDYKSNLIGLWVRRRWPMKLVTTVHGWVKFTWKTPLYYALDRFSLPRYDHVICVSDDLHDRCLQLGVPKSRCTWIENAIDTEQFRRTTTPAEAKQRLGFESGRPLIGAIGRLSPEKGFDVLLQSMRQLRDQGLECNMAIVGEGTDRLRLEGLINELQLGNCVQLLGYRADVIPLLECFDVFALSSYREGLPNVVLEAMAIETPVVATAIAGLPKLITDGHQGLLVQPGDSAGLAAALGRVIGDSALADTLKGNARSLIENRFSFARRMRKVADIYDQVLQSGR